MKPKQIKKILLSEINLLSNNVTDYIWNPKCDFSRNRKLPFSTIMKSIIGMGSKSFTNELIDSFDMSDLPSTSAFVQQRIKIKPEAFKTIFDRFTLKISKRPRDGMAILAVDGSDIHIPTNPDDITSYHPGTNGQKPYNLLHLNALYDLEKHLYTDVIIQGKMDMNEHDALQDMVDDSNIPKALLIADRGYESYNNMAHIQEKGWFFLFALKME